MKNVSWSVAWFASLVVGCGGVAFGGLPGADAGGGHDDGGELDVSVTDANEAGPDAPADSPAACPAGSIQFVMQVAPGGTSYCTGSTGCAPGWLSIRPQGGTPFLLNGGCTTTCAACEPVACPLICAAPTRIPPSGVTDTWNGTMFDASTCGAGVSCVNQECAPAGTYVARMCGNAERTLEASVGACVGDATATCVEVPFTWPPAGGSATVTGVLGAAAGGGACCPAGWDLHDCAWPDGGAGLACHDPAKGCASSTVCGQGCDAVVMGRCADGG